MSDMERISAVYKIVNTVTGDFYIGSSKNVKARWAAHKCQSTWKRKSNNPMYQDMQKYGVNKFRFQILCPVMEEHLKQVEQELIEMLKPTYNNYNAKGINIKRDKETRRRNSIKYEHSDKRKEYRKKYRHSDKRKEYQKEYQKEYRQSEKGKEWRRKYYNRPCSYKGETLTLSALTSRFRRDGIPHALREARKYLIQ